MKKKCGMPLYQMLRRMEAPENAQGLFLKWVDDYRKVALAEGQKLFTFIPDRAVTDPRGFTEALFAFADEQGLDLVIGVAAMGAVGAYLMWRYHFNEKQ